MKCTEIKAVLWDMDGTLLDTEALSTQCIVESIAPLGGQCGPDLKAKLLGKPWPSWTRIVIDSNNLQGKIEPVQLFQMWETRLCTMCPELMPGADRLTSHFHSLNIPQCVCTSSSSKLVEAKRSKVPGLMSRFNFVLTGESVTPGRGKPHPDIYIQAAQRMQCDPSECLVFEDALSGVAAGRAAGCFVVAVPAKEALLAPLTYVTGCHHHHHHQQHQDPRKQFEELADVVLESLCDFNPLDFGLAPFETNQSPR